MRRTGDIRVFIAIAFAEQSPRQMAALAVHACQGESKRR